jgi:cobyrinic acid a,c-diamide synthase
MKSLLISAASKSSGKTTVSMGLTAALTRRGHAVQCYKKGPDYIDAMWLSHASGRPCRNLDFFTSSHEEIMNSFTDHAEGVDLGLVEGNKGLFDGVDLEGSDSNAALAELLGIPVLLVIDSRGMTRGIAPLLTGYRQFGSKLTIAGVILNQVGGPRHEGKLRAAIERYTDIPILGAIGRHPSIVISERHLGLMPPNEAADVGGKIGELADIIAADVDIDRIAAGIAVEVEAGAGDTVAGVGAAPKAGSDRITIAYARDAAFGFYYPDDLEALSRAGADLHPFDTLRDDALPEASGLLIGGGFPEVLAPRLSANSSMRASIRGALEGGMPAYAECGGLMYLSRELSYQGGTHPMVGFVPGDSVMHKRPIGRGYVQLAGTGALPWPDPGGEAALLPAHEFHYASLENLPEGLAYAYEVKRGHGIDGRRDGLVIGNLVAGFSHHRQTAANRWADRFVAFVRACSRAVELEPAQRKRRG